MRNRKNNSAQPSVRKWNAWATVMAYIDGLKCKNTKIASCIFFLLGCCLVLFYMTTCVWGDEANDPRPEGLAFPIAEKFAADEVLKYTYEVINVWPHDRRAFTQGLVFFNGALFESTGLKGQSTLRKVNLETGEILKRSSVPAHYFAEGLAVLNGMVYQLTYRDQKGFVYNLETFQLERDFAYKGEGWGLTTDGQWLIMSDGTDQVRFLDPVTFEEKRRIIILNNGRPVNRLNELEYIKGEIFANVWGTDNVVRIDPVTGTVVGEIDFAGLLAAQDHDSNTNVLNGIAYDAVNDRLFLTGKYWPKIFEVRLKLKK